MGSLILYKGWAIRWTWFSNCQTERGEVPDHTALLGEKVRDELPPLSRLRSAAGHPADGGAKKGHGKHYSKNRRLADINPGHRSGAWVKSRVSNEQEFVVGGLYTFQEKPDPFWRNSCAILRWQGGQRLRSLASLHLHPEVNPRVLTGSELHIASDNVVKKLGSFFRNRGRTRSSHAIFTRELVFTKHDRRFSRASRNHQCAGSGRP